MSAEGARQARFPHEISLLRRWDLFSRLHSQGRRAGAVWPGTLADIRVVHAIYESGRTKQAIALPEVRGNKRPTIDQGHSPGPAHEELKNQVAVWEVP